MDPIADEHFRSTFWMHAHHITRDMRPRLWWCKIVAIRSLAVECFPPRKNSEHQASSNVFQFVVELSRCLKESAVLPTPFHVSSRLKLISFWVDVHRFSDRVSPITTCRRVFLILCWTSSTGFSFGSILFLHNVPGNLVPANFPSALLSRCTGPMHPPSPMEYSSKDAGRSMHAGSSSLLKSTLLKSAMDWLLLSWIQAMAPKDNRKCGLYWTYSIYWLPACCISDTGIGGLPLFRMLERSPTYNADTIALPNTIPLRLWSSVPLESLCTLSKKLSYLSDSFKFTWPAPVVIQSPSNNAPWARSSPCPFIKKFTVLESGSGMVLVFKSFKVACQDFS